MGDHTGYIPQQIIPGGITMATKVDRTASMMCRRSGCSSEKLAERVIELEAALEAAQGHLVMAAAAHECNRCLERANRASVALKGE
jgi:GTP cyclohydrolase I